MVWVHGILIAESLVVIRADLLCGLLCGLLCVGRNSEQVRRGPQMTWSKLDQVLVDSEMISFFWPLASKIPQQVATICHLTRNDRFPAPGPVPGLLLGLVLGAVLAPQLAALTQQNPGQASASEDPATNLSSIEEQVEVLERDLRLREQRRDHLYAELEQSERDIAALARGGRQLAAMVVEQRDALDALHAQLKRVREELTTARAVLAELLRSAHAMGRGDRLRMVFNQEDPSRSGRLFGYYRALGQQRARQIALVNQHAKQLQGISQQAAAEAERLSELARRQEDTRTRLSAAQQERSLILANLDQAIAAGRDHVESLRENATRLRELAGELSRHSEISDVFHLNQDSLATKRGKLHWPINDTQVLTSFRPRAAGGMHGDGLLLAATPGAEVLAVHGGQVVYADWLRGFGLLLVIDHHDGYMTIYGHNQSLLKEPGEWVSSGETIALAGASGGGNRDGLYFALRHRGEPIDPQPWFAQHIR